MKKIYLVLISLFLAATTSQAQLMLSWANTCGGANNDYVYSCVKDTSGNIYTAGYFSGTVDFDSGAGTYNISSSGIDAFVMKTDSSGTLKWVTKLGSTGTDQAISLAFDNNMHLVIGGIFNGTVDFDPGAGTATRSSNGGDDFFVLKLDTSGQFIWAKTVGGNSNDWINDICVDPFGTICIGGQFKSTNSVDFDPGTGTATSSTSGTWSGFVLKFDVDGNYIWHKKFAGSSNVIVWKVLSDSLKNVYIDGTLAGTADFSPDTTLSSAGGTDIFILKLDSAGGFTWINKISSPANLDARGFALYKNQSFYLTGFFEGTVDFNPRGGIYNLTSAGNTDVFILNMDTAGNFIWAKKIGAANADGTYGAYINDAGQLLISGGFSSTVNFDPGLTDYTITSNGSGDVFVMNTDLNGNFNWVKSFGGVNMDYSLCVLDLDSVHPVVCGSYSGTADFNPGPGVYSKTSNGLGDIFVVRLEPCVTAEGYDTIQACDSYTWINGVTYTYSISGISHTLPGAAASGCDSIVHLNLSIYPSYFFTEKDTICAGDELFWRGYQLTTGGLHYDNLTTIHGCDSVYELLLTVIQDQEVISIENICAGDSIFWRGMYFKTTGNYYDSVTHTSSCDTVFILNLTVNPTYFSSQSAGICSGESFIWHGNPYTTAGMYYDSLVTQHGCDSVFELNLVVHPVYLNQINAEICDGESFIWCGNPYTTAGIYYDSLLTQNGCDSVFELDLVVFDLPNVDIISTDSFVCVYNTPLNLAAIPAGGVWNGQGLSGNNFDPAAAGIGSWIITYHFADTNGCENADTITILVDACTGLENEVFSGITLYPNPTSGQLSITFPAEDDYTLSFIDALGQIILTTKISAQKTVQIDLKSFAPGVYMLKIENAEGFVLKRVVLER